MRHPGRVTSMRELAGAIGEPADRHRQIARWVSRLARRLAVSPLHAPVVESMPHVGYRFLPIASSEHRQPGI